MIETLDQLTQHIRQNVPQPKAIVNLHLQEKTGVVTFVWHAREFVVKRSLEVLELKGQNLYVTGATMLMQSALRSAGKSEVVLESLMDAIRHAEELIKDKDEKQKESGLALLVSVKATLRKQVTVKISRMQPAAV
jgi:hypothetical protein